MSLSRHRVSSTLDKRMKIIAYSAFVLSSVSLLTANPINKETEIDSNQDGHLDTLQFELKRIDSEFTIEGKYQDSDMDGAWDTCAIVILHKGTQIYELTVTESYTLRGSDPSSGHEFAIIDGVSNKTNLPIEITILPADGGRLIEKFKVDETNRLKPISSDRLNQLIQQHSADQKTKI